MKKNLILKKLLPEDANPEYLKWMNDKEVTKFTEQRFKKHSLSEIKNFIKEKNISKVEFLFGIFVVDKSVKTHVGNIKLGPINKFHQSAEVCSLLWIYSHHLYFSLRVDLSHGSGSKSASSA